MGRLIKSAVIGGVVFSLWAVIFGFIHGNEVGLSHFQNRDAVFEVLRQNISGSGLYVYPLISDEIKGETDFLDLQRKGPIIFLEYSERLDNVGIRALLGIMIPFLVAFIAASLLQAVPNLTRWGKALFVMFVASTGEVNWHLQNCLMPAYGTGLTLINIIDVTVGWFLAGMAMVKWGVKEERIKDERES